jgi:hypothetical protein
MVSIGALVVTGEFVSLLDKGRCNLLLSIAPALEFSISAIGSRSALPDAIEDSALLSDIRDLH